MDELVFWYGMFPPTRCEEWYYELAWGGLHFDRRILNC
jgi:hypothetical protein